MAAAIQYTIRLTLFSLHILVIHVSPTNQTNNLLSISNLKVISNSKLLQDEGQPNIKKNDITVLARIEEQVAKSRGEIQKAIVEKSFASSKANWILQEGTIYKNPSHNEMIKTFKIWTYKEGDIPLMHNGPMKNIYNIEGDFIEEIERKGNPIVARSPDEAHAYFIPISIANIVRYLYKPEEAFGFMERMQAIMEDYIHVIAEKYPYWNHSEGADHFFVSCHDWGPFISLGNPKTLQESDKSAFCNANSSEGFIPSRDVSMTEICGSIDNIPTISKGQSPFNRSILAFFAGGNHGFVRKILFQYWENKEDNDIQVYNYLPKDKNYTELLRQSKYCLCPSGYEVASTRATEAIYAGCVPVMIKDHYVLPYSDVLDWSQFSLQVPVDKIQDLKRVLQEIPFSKYLDMQRKVIKVQRHFVVNLPAKHFDVIHMILHSIWLRRVDVKLAVFDQS